VALLGSTDEEIKMTETAADLRKIVSEMSAMFSEREPVIRSLVVTVLARQHSLLLGPPGAAKSALARELTARFDGANYWEILLSKFVTPPQIFGPVDVAALTAKGEYRQVFEGHATDCHIAFLDEIFKCGDAALNSMLAYLNERVYHPEAGGAPVGCRLIAAITASNELAQTDALEAMFDRLLVRIEVGHIKDPSNFAAFLGSAAGSPAPACPATVTLPDLITATQQDVPAVTVPDAVIDAICTLRAQLRRQEITVSDRRWKQAIRLLQASAYLDSRTEISAEDLVILKDVLWEQISQRANVEREVLTLVNPGRPRGPGPAGRDQRGGGRAGRDGWPVRREAEQLGLHRQPEPQACRGTPERHARRGRRRGPAGHRSGPDHRPVPRGPRPGR
jgi:MoxR-like ATPase